MTETNYSPELHVSRFELGTIETNLNELEAYTTESLKKYQGLVYTDDQIKDAKDDRKNLNNLKKQLNSWRIQKEREFNAPFAKVKDQCNRICSQIDGVSGEIDSQVKAYEQSKKDEKKAKIAAYWEGIRIHDIPLEMIFDPRWLNVTCSEKEWKAALNQKKAMISADLASFANYADPKMVDFMITEYMKTLDVQTCLNRWNEQIEAERRAEEAKAKAEAIRLAREEEARKRAEMAAQREAQKAAEAPAPEPVQTAAEPEQDDPKNYLYSPTFKMIDLTFDQAMDLTRYMKRNNLKYMSISKEKRKI